MEVLNINVGILGHVDSGKTSLVKALSTVLSTAALDKNPQSRDRGITLDLGFSAFTVALPEHLPQDQYSHLQFTLVDCPGHASLIRTIIGGAQIMDMMLLVVDATKGMQAQTTECVVIGEAVMSSGADVIVVLNKADLIPEEERSERLNRAKEDITAQLAGTKFSSASFVSCAAAVGGEKTAAAPAPHRAVSQNNPKGRAKKGVGPGSEKGARGGGSSREKGTPGNGGGSCGGSGGGGGSEVADPPKGGGVCAPAACREDASTMGVDAVAFELSRRARVPSRRASALLYFAFDHCFSVRGQGTILTGTVLTGEVKVNQLVELPALRVQKKVKSMQMFRKPVSVARAGDRVGICLASLDAKLLERGVVTTPGSVRPASTAIALVRKVPAFAGQCLSGANCHVSLGHATAMATATFFGASELRNSPSALFGGVAGDKKASAAALADAKGGEGLSLDDVAALPFPWGAAFVQQDRLLGRAADGVSMADGGDDRGCDASSSSSSPGVRGDGRGFLQYCHLAFHTPVITPPSSIVLGSRLDNPSIPAGTATAAAYCGEGHAGKGLAEAPEHCRIAFHGRLVLLAAGDAVDGARKAPAGDAGGALEFGAQPGQLKLFTEKCKTGVVFRAGADDGRGHAGGRRVEVFGKDLFKKETNMSPFVGMLLLTEGGCIGHLDSAFGKGGRFKASFPAGTSVRIGDKVFLNFRKYFRDPSKRMHQDYLREDLERQRHQGQQQQQQRSKAGNNNNNNSNSKNSNNKNIRDDNDGGESFSPPLDLDNKPAATSRVEEETQEVPAEKAQEAQQQQQPPPLLARDGVIDSVKDGGTAVFDAEPAVVAFVSGLFSQEEDIRAIAKLGMAVRTERAGLTGKLRGPFGKLGKCKVEFAGGEGRSLRAGDRVFAPR